MASPVIENPDDFVDASTEEDEDGDSGSLSTFLLKHQRPINSEAELTKGILRRIKALKQLQLTTTHLEATFYTEVHALECKYSKLYTPLFEKREAIVNGTYEPTQEECDWASDTEGENNTIVEIKGQNLPESCGIPNFWLKIFLNVGCLAEMVQPADEPILSHLNDIKVACEETPMSFTLTFHFTPNKYFTNEVLTKQYFMQCQLDKDDPFSFDGPEIYSCKGCTIDWKEDMNVTQRAVEKKQKDKSGVTRTVTKISQSESFFNFFSPPELNDHDKGEEIDQELRQLLTSDFEVGQFIRENIVPRAVLFFTGEAIEEESDSEEESTDETDSEVREPTTIPGAENCKQQ